MGRIFGTDGVRGIANTELTAGLAFRLGMAGVQVLSKADGRPTFLIGKDTRVSGDMLEDALSAGILSMGGNVIKAGVIPTPAVAHLVKDMGADAGVVISASHNPFEYNGIKFFNGDGFKLDDAIEDEIEGMLDGADGGGLGGDAGGAGGAGSGGGAGLGGSAGLGGGASGAGSGGNADGAGSGGGAGLGGSAGGNAGGVDGSGAVTGAGGSGSGVDGSGAVTGAGGSGSGVVTGASASGIGSGAVYGARLGRSADASAESSRRYADFLIASAAGVSAKGMKLALDCANGAAYDVAGRVFEALGAEVCMIGNRPDGLNINGGCGSTHPEALAEMAVREGADMGLAFDGDADRLIAVDENGSIVDGDKIMYVCARAMKMNGELRDDLVTATVMSNMGLGKALGKIGCKVQYTGVGDRYVLEQMLKTGSVLGGEQSGHIIFLDRSTTGDGILAGIQLLRSVGTLGMKLSELAGQVTVYPQVLRNARVRNENKELYMDDKSVCAEIAKIEEDMAGEGRVLIRPSGTEPLVRVMLEGSDIKKITHMAEGLAELITEKLG